MNWARRSQAWAGRVLAWFVLGLGVASAAPLLQPAAVQIVCGADGQLRTVAAPAEAWGEPAQPHTLHCPLCLLGTGAAPMQPSPQLGPGLAHARELLLRVKADPVHTNHSGTPLPARGPPTRS